MTNYNTQLQSNNTDLQMVLQALQNKAAGGSGVDPFAPIKAFTYTVDAISGASYGFALNDNGYYESQNKGKDSSYAICRVNLTVNTACNIVFDVINYAESNFDYAVFSMLDDALNLNNSADSDAKENFKGRQSASVVNVTYSNVSVGNHFIDIKFIKDGSVNNNNDSVQIKLQEQIGGLSQETINKILAADTDLKAGNIKSGVDIFGVIGTYSASGGNTDTEDGLIDGTLLTYTNDRVENIRSYTFAYCSSLTSVNFPACKSIGSSAFYDCYNLTSVSFPVCTNIGSNAFYSCSKLTTVNFPACTNIGSSAFTQCYNLKSLYLTGSSLCKLSKSNAFASTPIGGYSTPAGTYGSIYVPASLLTSYQNATNWTYFSSRFVAYDDGGGNGGHSGGAGY